MGQQKIVSQKEWLKARVAHLEQEKKFDQLRDKLSAQRRELPWTKVTADYIFEGLNEELKMEELFQGKSQLIIYHFMYDPAWKNGGCPSCSLLADHFDGMIPHLDKRDVSFVAISKATPEQIQAYRQRLGWKFKWFSSRGNTFNEDFNVSFTAEQIVNGGTYNYQEGVQFEQEERPGASVFTLKNGEIFHTYSTYARGLDRLIGTYHYLDMVPRGRDEDQLDWPMQWVRRHDEY